MAYFDGVHAQPKLRDHPDYKKNLGFRASGDGIEPGRCNKNRCRGRAEIAVLRGAVEALKANRDVLLLMDIHPDLGVDPFAVCDLLSSLGFSTYEIEAFYNKPLNLHRETRQLMANLSGQRKASTKAIEPAGGFLLEALVLSRATGWPSQQKLQRWVFSFPG